MKQARGVFGPSTRQHQRPRPKELIALARRIRVMHLIDDELIRAVRMKRMAEESANPSQKEPK